MDLGDSEKLFDSLLKDDFTVTIYQRKNTDIKNLPITNDLKKAYESEIIFYAVPIGVF